MENANRPANPIWTDDMPVEGDSGLTKREYFAAKAMEGIISTRNTDEGIYSIEVADFAVSCADALLEALED